MFVRELQKGDIVLLREDVRIEVRGTIRGEIGPEQKPVTCVFDTMGKQWSLHPGDIVQPIHRPWPEEDREGLQLQENLRQACKAGVRLLAQSGPEAKLYSPEERVRVLARLREALDAYELGKPPEVEEGSEKHILGCLRDQIAD